MDPQYDQNYANNYTYEDTVSGRDAYLQVEIKDKNYDWQSFVAFLDEKKPGIGPDMQNYTINEIYDFVYEFQTRVYEQYNGGGGDAAYYQADQNQDYQAQPAAQQYNDQTQVYNQPAEYDQ